MFPLIDDLLAEAVRTGFTPLAIRLGSTQMQLFEDWTARFTVGDAPGSSSSGSSEYDGLPIHLDPRDNFRGLIAADNSMLILPGDDKNTEENSSVNAQRGARPLKSGRRR